MRTPGKFGPGKPQSWPVPDKAIDGKDNIQGMVDLTVFLVCPHVGNPHGAFFLFRS
jgi:hypothetical protein